MCASAVLPVLCLWLCGKGKEDGLWTTRPEGVTDGQQITHVVTYVSHTLVPPCSSTHSLSWVWMPGVNPDTDRNGTARGGLAAFCHGKRRCLLLHPTPPGSTWASTRLALIQQFENELSAILYKVAHTIVEWYHNTEQMIIMCKESEAVSHRESPLAALH